MTAMTLRQVLVANLIVRLPDDGRRERLLWHLLATDGRRCYLDPRTGTFTIVEGNAQPPGPPAFMLTADDIPPALRPPDVPDTPAGLLDEGGER